MERVGIIGPADDPQVIAVRRSLRDRGVTPELLDLSAFPGRLKLSLRAGQPFAENVALDSVGTWYVRSLPLPLPFFPPVEGTEQFRLDDLRRSYAAGRERRSFLSGFVAAMERHGARLVNPPSAMAQHFRKPEQLTAMADAGVPVPRTLITNDPDAVLAFAGDIGGPVVYKPVAGGGMCRRMTEAHYAPERLARLAGAPVIFQAEVPGRNIRVYLVNGRVVAGYEIVSARLDYRGAETDVRPTALTADEERACVRAAEACAMSFTGIDLRRPDDGAFAVLECNPSPMFATVERRTGASRVSEALAEALVTVPVTA